jgi:putative ABC transport system permease protein
VITQDLRFALRLARRSPVFTLTAVLTLALGIGANTAIFQLIEAVGLRSLPVVRPNELAEVRIVGGNRGFGLNPGPYGQLTRPVWEELRLHQEAFSGAFAWQRSVVGVGERSELRRANGLAVTGDFFRVLGIAPYRGRLIEPGDETPCPSSKAVVSYAYWQREMAGRDISSATTLKIDGGVHEIVGVTPPQFFGLAVGESFDVAVPLCKPKDLRPEIFGLTVMGRLRPDWSLERASAHFNALSASVFDTTAPSGYNADATARFKAFRLGAYSAATGVSALRSEYERSLQLLLAITGLVLLIACANLANLMLARASARDREVAVRLAIGASRGRLVRQFLIESGLLAIIGAAVAIGLAQQLSAVLVWALSTTDGSPELSFTTNWRVMLFTAITAGATCMIFGLAPALRARKVEPAVAMKAGGRGTTAGRERFSLQRAMVVLQIATSVVLLVGAFLFVGSFYKLITFNPGMRVEGVTVAFIAWQQTGIPEERNSDYRRELIAEIKSIPGVLNAGSTTNVPLFGGSWTHGVRVGAKEDDSKFAWVSPGYFATMNIPILEGRDFTLADTRASARVLIVNQTFVRKYSPNGSPIGLHVQTNPEPDFPATVYEIVGVIPDTSYDSLRRTTTPAMAFAPDTQYPPSRAQWTAIMIHSTVDPSALATTVRRRFAESHRVVISEYSGFQRAIRDGLVRERLLAILAGVFGVLAAVLAMVGLYGMIAFAASQRRQEIGVRVALGATRRQVVTMMMREAMVLLAIGVALGAGTSLVVSRSAASLLFGLTPRDPLALVGACTLLSIVAGVASFLPARGASTVDPLTALRQE